MCKNILLEGDIECMCNEGFFGFFCDRFNLCDFSLC